MAIRAEKLGITEGFAILTIAGMKQQTTSKASATQVMSVDDLLFTLAKFSALLLLLFIFTILLIVGNAH